ncbi:MAG: CehA/McbA family metallohydrolase [Pedosphaera sp.]|nr:CehA/McbA family metallohydrolase [Pedosphaera sp.]
MSKLRFVSVFCCVAALGQAAAGPVVIDPGTHHLGTPGFPEWQEFEGRTPHGRRLDLTFEAKKNETTQTLFLRQWQVKYSWAVLLNDRRLGRLATIDTRLVHDLPIPKGLLRDGTNKLSIVAPKATDDIEVGDFWIAPGPRKTALGQAWIEVSVRDAIPCRITVTDEKGHLAALHSGKTGTLALRPGVAYTGDGSAQLGVLPGRYTVYASRGFEYGVAHKQVTVAAGETAVVPLEIRREVPTPNLVACDTHIHTLTFSGHGDSTTEERMLTIAGEGIELAVSTDHNHHADYQPAAVKTATSQHFTTVIGNEVTTKTAHFNAFPIEPDSPLPNHELSDWTQLMQAMRAVPGVRVITLNHPRDDHTSFTPLDPEHFNPVSGAHLDGEPYTFDALEVVTSAAMQSDIMLLYHDWFAMLNHGTRIAAIGSSDTHDVSRFILGQARTYVVCPDDDPANIDVARACESFRSMRAYVSMGLLTRMSVGKKYTVGDLATGLGDTFEVTVNVLGPSWVRADRVELYANGQRIRQREITPDAAIVKADVTWHLAKPAYDLYLVAIATGPGIDAPFWDIPRSYQPKWKRHVPRVQGATNPIWIDADGDGQHTSPREYARREIQRAKGSLANVIAALKPYDQAVAAQAASLLHEAGHDPRSGPLGQALKPAAPVVRAGFDTYAATLPAAKE